MKIYIAGPMSGIEDHNKVVFNALSACLEDYGYTPINPALLPDNMNPVDYMPICLQMLDKADAILLLPGWENSKGATIEKLYAEYQNKMLLEIRNIADAWTH